MPIYSHEITISYTHTTNYELPYNTTTIANYHYHDMIYVYTYHYFGVQGCGV